MSTIRDVAAAAEVSVSTVSLALNRPGRVREETRRRVLDAADALGFVPKADAVARARRGVGRIGVLGPFSAYAAAGRRLNGVLQAATGPAVEVVVFDQPSAATAPSPLLASLPRTGRLDGLVVSSLPLDDTVARRLADLRLPVVLLDVRHPGFSSVHVDDTAGGRLVAGHLLGLGHRRLSFLGEAQDSDRYVSPGERRLTGYRDALAAAGTPLPDTAVGWTRRELPAARAAARALLAGPDRPTAVFAGDDLLAAAVVQAGRELGLAVPADLAVVGFDDTDVAEALDLTTVRQPLEASGRLALRMVLEQLAGRDDTGETVLDLTLVPRASTTGPSAHG